MKNLQKLFIIFSFLFIQTTTINQNNTKIIKNTNNILNTENISKNKTLTNRKLEEKENEEPLTGLSVEKYKKFIEKLKSNTFKNIVFLTGAGASTSAGIPDFRSKGGIFQQLQNKYHLLSPEDVFDIEIFKNRPEFFYEFCKDFNPENHSPTLFHYFMGYIDSKKKLQYVFTQNIDGLDLKCGINEKKIVFAHGNFETAHCPDCEKKFDKKLMREYINKGEILYCDNCGCPVKPHITFYGEPLPFSFFQKGYQIDKADLVIICGTSLLVSPFNQLPDNASRKAIKLVINKEPFKRIMGVRPFGFEDEESNDIFFKGECDNAVKKIIKDVGWEKEFYDFVEKTKKEEEAKIKN